MTHRVLIIGLGQIGLGYDLHLDASRIYSHARAFSRHPAFELVGGVDASAEQCARLTATCGCPAYLDLRSALSAQTVDVLIVAVPTGLHAAVVREALSLARPRAVLCEKPMGADINEARLIVESCRAQGVALYVNYMRRADAAVNDIRDRIAHGRIVGPIKGICWYSKGIKHNGSHFCNLLEYWLGPLQDVQVVDPGRSLDGHDAEPDVAATFRNGRVMFLAAREEAFSHYTIELLASNGRLRYEQGGRQVGWQPARAGEIDGYTVLSDDVENLASGMDRYQWHVAEQLAAALDGGNSHLCTGAEALVTAKNIQNIMNQRASLLTAAGKACAQPGTQHE